VHGSGYPPLLGLAWREYHEGMKWAIPAPVAVFGLFGLSVIFVAGSSAQVNGAPPSVTSPGFGGRAINGTRPSVTSLGPNGYAPIARQQFRTTLPPIDGKHEHHHHLHEYPSYGEVYVPVPVPIDSGMSGEANGDDDEEYQGGPTVFDRRGNGAESYVPPVKDPPPAHLAQNADPDAGMDGQPVDAQPEAPAAPTLLVFKDRHTIEVGNYAIVGQTLFDLTPGHARRIALADLDLEATQKQNDDRGVNFQLPPAPRAN
jgi:hypothetical protein